MIENRIKCDVKDCGAFEVIGEFGGLPAGWHTVSYVEYKLLPSAPDAKSEITKVMRQIGGAQFGDAFGKLVNMELGNKPALGMPPNPTAQTAFIRHVCPKHPMPAFDAADEG